MIDLNKIFFSSVINRIKLEISIDEANFEIINAAMAGAETRFLYINSKRKDKYNLSPWNVDQVTIFLILLNAEIHKISEDLAEILYYYIRTKFSIDVYPARKLPKLFDLAHPIGTILGNATYGEGLVCYQRVTVGGDYKLRYPVIGDHVVLYAGATVIGNSRIGNNSTIGAGVSIIGEDIQDGVVVYMDAGVRKIKHNTHSNEGKFFK